MAFAIGRPILVQRDKADAISRSLAISAKHRRLFDEGRRLLLGGSISLVLRSMTVAPGTQPLGRGFLAGRFRSHEELVREIVPIPSTRSAHRLDENVAAAALRLSPADLAELDTLPQAIEERTDTAASIKSPRLRRDPGWDQ